MIVDKLLAGAATVLTSALIAVSGYDAVQRLTVVAWSWRHAIEGYVTW